MRSGRRGAWLLAIVALLAWPLHDRAVAHAGLRFSSPLDGATLGDNPTSVQLTFVERPEPSLSTIRVVDATGAIYHDGSPRGVESDPLSLTVPLRRLGRGVYTVHWRVVSAVDGHASAGVFVFGVLVAPSGPSGSPASMEATASSAEPIARAIFLAGLVLLLGAAAAHIGRFGLGRELGLAVVGWMVSIVGLVLLAIAQRRVAAVGVLELTATAIGRALVWRLVAIGAAGVLLALAVRATRTARPHLARLAVWGLALAVFAAVAVHSAAGHAGAGRWPLAAAVGSHVVHIAAAGIWLGGLAALLAGVRGAPSDLKTTAVQRFSRLAAVGLALVLATGIARSAIEIVGWGDLTSTTYGRVLSAKVALLIGIAALGALNRWCNVPRAASSLEPLRRTAGVELALTGAALAAAGFLGTLAPPAASQSIPGIDVSGADFGTTVRVRLQAASDHPGPNRFLVRIEDYDSRMAVRADRVSLRFTPVDDPGITSTSLALAETPGDAYAGSGANLTFDGRWRIGVQIERAGSSVEVPLEVETRSTPQPISIERSPGQRANYTVQVSRSGFVRFSPDSARPGKSQVLVSCFDGIFDLRRVDRLVVLSRESDGTWQPQPVRRLDEYRFVFEIAFERGPNTIVAIARSTDGTRLRATVTIDMLGQ